MVVCIEKLACQYCQLKHTGRSRLRRTLFWWLLGENPGAVEGSGIVLIVLALALVSRKKKEAVSVKRI